MKTRSSTYPLRLPAEDGTSLNQFVATVVAEKVAALRTVNFFAARKEKGDREAFRRLMACEGGVPPQAGDEL